MAFGVFFFAFLFTIATAQFQTPPANDPPPANKESSGLSFPRYSVQTITWKCDYPSYKLWVYPNDGTTLRTQYIDRGEGSRSGAKSFSYNWTVDTTFDFKQWSFYFKVYDEEDPKGELSSQLFSIIDPEARSTNASDSRSAPTVTVTFTPLPGSSGSGNGGLSTALKVGLCVGITVGVLAAAGFGFFLGRGRRAKSIRSDDGKAKGPVPQDLSSLDPKWQNPTLKNWTAPRAIFQKQKPVFEVSGRSVYPEMRGDERHERHELPGHTHPWYRRAEYGVP